MKRTEMFDLYQDRDIEHKTRRVLALISAFTAGIKGNKTVHPGYISSMVEQAEDVIILQQIFIDLLFRNVQQNKAPAIEVKHPTLSQ